MNKFELVKIKVLSHKEIYNCVVDGNMYYAFKEVNEDEVVSYGITTITDEKVLESLLELLNSQCCYVLKDIIWISTCYIKVEEYDLQNIRLKQMLGNVVRHFKGNKYLVIGTAEHTETGEILVVYKALYGEYRTFVRPIDMFLSEVDREKYPEVKQKYRFELNSNINEGNTGIDLITTNEMINSIEDFKDKNFTQVKVKIVDINSNFNIGDIFYAIKDNNENMYGIIKNTKDVVMYDLMETRNKNNSPVFGNYIEWIDDSYVEEI